MTTRHKYWLHFRTAKQPTMQVSVHIEAQTARNFGLGTVREFIREPREVREFSREPSDGDGTSLSNLEVAQAALVHNSPFLRPTVHRLAAAPVPSWSTYPFWRSRRLWRVNDGSDEVMTMNETYVTVSGNVVGDPVVRATRANVPFVTFRVASNVRRVDFKTGEYIDAGPTS
jgi:hypothetical protein